MSFFSGDSKKQGPDPLFAAKLEHDIMTDMFNKMAQNCFQKCVFNTHDAELSVGEMACVDRCVGKYMESMKMVNTVANDYSNGIKK